MFRSSSNFKDCCLSVAALALLNFHKTFLARAQDGNKGASTFVTTTLVQMTFGPKSEDRTLKMLAEVMLYAGAIFTTLYIICNLQVGPIS